MLSRDYDATRGDGDNEYVGGVWRARGTDKELRVDAGDVEYGISRRSEDGLVSFYGGDGNRGKFREYLRASISSSSIFYLHLFEFFYLIVSLCGLQNYSPNQRYLCCTVVSSPFIPLSSLLPIVRCKVYLVEEGSLHRDSSTSVECNELAVTINRNTNDWRSSHLRDSSTLPNE
jgi:hypothetical protein